MEDTDAIERDHRRYGQNWDRNARVDAMWSVLSLPERFGGKWDKEEFFDIGRREVSSVFRYMEEMGIMIGAGTSCIDFGCGLGRISQAMAQRFTRVIGVDISPAMIEQARAYIQNTKSNVPEFALIQSLDLSVLGSGQFDMVYSNITLQHLNNNLQRHYIKQFAELLRPKGLAIFQIPSQLPRARLFAARNLANLGHLIVSFIRMRLAPWTIKMEMNTLSREEVAQIGLSCGLHLLHSPYIDWKSFYLRQEFRISNTDPDPKREFAESPLYFFLKE